jgi:alpha-D-xyloside xylohydrolase
MFGQHLLVAPITEEGATEVNVYLPAGSWLSLFNSEVINGDRWIAAPADLTQIPVFIKENAVIPLNLDASYELASDVGSRVDGYERLSLIIYVTKDIEYQFKDDLGNTIELTVAKKGHTVEALVTITGDYLVTLLFRAMGMAAAVKLNDKAQTHVEDLEQFNSGSYLQRGKDVLVTFQQGITSISIEL